MNKDSQLEIIDWEQKGNLIRLYFGKNGNQWGDDWDDAPYEHNAGVVNDEYVAAIKDYVVPFRYVVKTNADDVLNSDFSKQDFVENTKLSVLKVFSSQYDGKELAKLHFGQSINDIDENFFIPIFDQLSSFDI